MEKLFLIQDKFTNNLYYLTGVTGIQGSKTATVTEYVTPSGKKISDNSYVNPQTLSFSLHTSHLAMHPQKVLKPNNKNTDILSLNELKELIDNWINNAIFLDITTFEESYKNMVLNSVSVSEGDTLGSWNPTLSFTEVRTAAVQTVKLNFPANQQEKANGDAEKDLGTNNGINAGQTVVSTAVGAAAGAAIGSFIPGIGTAIGAGIGALVGFFGSIL